MLSEHVLNLMVQVCQDSTAVSNCLQSGGGWSGEAQAVMAEEVHRGLGNGRGERGSSPLWERLHKDNNFELIFDE